MASEEACTGPDFISQISNVKCLLSFFFILQDSSDLSGFLGDNLRVHSRSTTESRDREREQGQCAACGTNLNQLKQEAIHLALSRGQSLAKPPFEPSLSTGSLLGQSETKHGDRATREAAMAAHQPHSRTHSPQSPRTPQRTPQTLRRRGPKLPNPDMDRWVEEQQQLVASKSASNTDGVTIYTYHKVPLKAFSYHSITCITSPCELPPFNDLYG